MEKETLMQLKEEYIKLLKSTKRKGVDNLIKYLEGTDFFTAPASTKYHNSFEGGLVDHSINVYNQLLNKVNYEFEDGQKYQKSLIIVSLLHDVCKACFYTVGTKNVKVDGKWKQEAYYQVNDHLPLGHGEKSAMIVSKFINLNTEEMMAIRWHMGFSEPKENYYTIGNVFNKYKLAVALHVADLEATYYVENNNNK